MFRQPARRQFQGAPGSRKSCTRVALVLPSPYRGTLCAVGGRTSRIVAYLYITDAKEAASSSVAAGSIMARSSCLKRSAFFVAAGRRRARSCVRTLIEHARERPPAAAWADKTFWPTKLQQVVSTRPLGSKSALQLGQGGGV